MAAVPVINTQDPRRAGRTGTGLFITTGRTQKRYRQHYTGGRIIGIGIPAHKGRGIPTESPPTAGGKDGKQ